MLVVHMRIFIWPKYDFRSSVSVHHCPVIVTLLWALGVGLNLETMGVGANET